MDSWITFIKLSDYIERFDFNVCGSIGCTTYEPLLLATEE